MGAAIGLLGLTGCTSIHDHRGYIIDKTLVASVEPGIDNRTSVEKTLGRPTFISQFGNKDWFYVSRDTSQSPFGRPHPVQEEVLRVRFDSAGNVAALDKSGMDRVVRLSPDGDQTPTLGKHRGFLEDLFGNIGAVGVPGAGGGAGGGGTGPNGS
jgi:outer membrane protein assembly factor BamE (lipoprotein component of BamABCDE complex)